MARRLLATLGVVLLLGACGDPKPSSPSAADLEGIDVTPAQTIAVSDDGFDPARVQVEVGQVVRLVNEGNGVHSFTAAEHFDTGRLQPGDDTTLVLTTTGEIGYHDALDPTHEGTLTVVAAPADQ